MTLPNSVDLQKIRGLRKLFIVACFILIGSLLLFYTMPWSRFIRETMVLTGVGIYGIATLLVIFAKCPRCGYLFHNVLGFNNPFSRRCSHCGLPLEGDDVS